MTVMGQVKQALAARLRGEGLAAMLAYEEERLRRYQTPVIVVGVRESAIERSGLLDYLGERQKETGESVEVYGRELRLSLSADVYTPRELGAAAGETAAENAAQALLSGLPEGLRAERIRFGQSAWDRASGMFLLSGSVETSALFEAEAQPESAVLREFILRGVLSE